MAPACSARFRAWHADDAAWAAGAAAEIGARADNTPNKAAQGVLAEWTAQGANTAGWTPRRTLAFALVAGEADPQPPLQLAAAAVVAREGPGATPAGSSRMARLFSRVRHDIEGADPTHNRLSPPAAPPGAGGDPATQGGRGPVQPLQPPAVDELESRIRALEAQLREANTTTISEGAVTNMTNRDHRLGDRVTAATASETDMEADVETDEEDRDVAGHGDPQGTSRIAAAAKTFAKDSSIHAASLAPMPSLPHLAREQDASPDLTIPSLTASVTAKLFDTMLICALRDHARSRGMGSYDLECILMVHGRWRDPRSVKQYLVQSIPTLVGLVAGIGRPPDLSDDNVDADKSTYVRAQEHAIAHAKVDITRAFHPELNLQ